MPDQFRDQIDKAMGNPGLQAALDANYSRRLNVRTQSYNSLPEDVDVMRQTAHAARKHTIDNLDALLEQFIRKVSANGITVHRAAGAAEAAAIVVELARKHGVKLVAKAKTMVGEEININAVLEKAGIEAVETDLGEYIVQIRGERPAHIITPAVHLRRSDVGQTFHEKLGIPYTDDIPTLTSAARDRLRQVFLQAGMGITGVNLGVAETGDLVTVTNEGNGRLVATLPPIHVALMGLERIVPSLDDLATMLYLLPRSATGQKLSVYVNMMRGPRRAGEMDGPQERHLVLVDNGRTTLLGSPVEDALMCIRCGACMNICPAFREMGGHGYIGPQGQVTPYPGPIGSVLSPALFGYAEFGHLARACSLCGACKEACPVDINLPEMLLRVRAAEVPAAEVPAQGRQTPNAPLALQIGLRGFAWMASSTFLFRLAQRMAGLFSRLVSPRPGWLRLPAFTGWGYSKDFPLPAARSFSRRWAERQSSPPGGVLLSERPLRAKQSQAWDVEIASGRESTGPRTDSPVDEAPPPSLEAWFAAELAALGGVYTACRRDELAQRVLEILRENGLEKIQAWQEAELPAGLLDGLRRAGIEITHDTDPSLLAGLTGAQAGVAESGTLLLDGGPGHPLAASLLTRTHIAVLPVEAIVARLPQALQQIDASAASTHVLISGPSRTADIEMTLTVGMHGPGKLYVICLKDSPA